MSLDCTKLGSSPVFWKNTKFTFNIFQLEKYIVTALDQDYHNLVRVLSQTSMFDEYLRSRIKSCRMTVLSQSGSIFHLRRRKWQPVTSTTVGYIHSISVSATYTYNSYLVLCTILWPQHFNSLKRDLYKYINGGYLDLTLVNIM